MGLPETVPFGTAYHTHTTLHTISAELRELPTLNSFKNTTQNAFEGLDSGAKTRIPGRSTIVYGRVKVIFPM